MGPSGETIMVASALANCRLPTSRMMRRSRRLASMSRPASCMSSTGARIGSSRGGGSRGGGGRGSSSRGGGSSVATLENALQQEHEGQAQKLHRGAEDHHARHLRQRSVGRVAQQAGGRKGAER